MRDAVDRRVVEEIRTGTATLGESYKGGGKGIIDSQKDVGGWPELRSLPAPVDTDPASWLEDLGHRFRILPLTPRIAWRSVEFDWPHKDPAERLICATALEHKLPLITHDQEITRWGGVPVVW